MNIKKGDLVKIITGNSKKKGKIGKIISINHKQQRVKIQNIANIKKHIKPKKNAKYPEGGIIKDIGSIHISNIMLMSEFYSRPVRTGTLHTKDNKKIRIIKGKNLDTIKI